MYKLLYSFTACTFESYYTWSLYFMIFFLVHEFFIQRTSETLVFLWDYKSLFSISGDADSRFPKPG